MSFAWARFPPHLTGFDLPDTCDVGMNNKTTGSEARTWLRRAKQQVAARALDSNTCFPTADLSMMASGPAVPTKGLGLSLVSHRKRLMVPWRSAMPLRTLRLRCLRVNLAKEPSTALSHEAEGRGEVEMKSDGAGRALNVGNGAS
jgi:hypothetical protein